MEEIVAKIDALAKQTNEQFEAMNGRLDRMDERLNRMDERLDGIDERLDRMDERFDRVERRLESLEEASQVTRDIVKDIELRFEERFNRLDAKADLLSGGQKEIRGDIARLQHDLFIEEGSRDYADNIQSEELRKLEQRVAALEARQGLTPQVA